MDVATARRCAGSLTAGMAGLQAGMMGACWMLLWLGISARWQGRSFCTSENLMASAFYGGDSIHSGFAWSTVAGTALYLLLYSVLGALFAALAARRLSRVRTMLAGMLFAVAWYYLSFRLLWKTALPLVALLHVEQPVILGHVLYGAVLGRFPQYLDRLDPPPAEPVPAESIPPESEPQPLVGHEAGEAASSEPPPAGS